MNQLKSRCTSSDAYISTYEDGTLLYNWSGKPDDKVDALNAALRGAYEYKVDQFEAAK